MAVNRKFLKKASTATLLMWMSVSLMSSLVYAEDIVPTDTPAVTETTPTETPVPAETTAPTPTPGSVINTGDAAAAADTQTAANTDVTVLPGAIDPNGCGVTGDTSCSGDITINNDNTATISAGLDAAATSGDNTSTPSGNIEINTGDASASGQIDTAANTNAVILETPSPTETITPTETPTPTPGESLTGSDTATPSADPDSQVQDLTVNNSNAADVANNADVTSLTGNNTGVTNSGSVAVDTGNAASLVNVLNIINTNIVGSDVHVLTLNLMCTQDADIDLNAIWNNLLIVDAEGNVVLNDNLQSPNLKITITNENQATLTNDVNVTADTGNNTATGSEGADISTGNAQAIANVTNLVNTNILGSKFLIGNINIYGSQHVNLILPRPDYFDPLSSAFIFRIPMSVQNQNLAAVDNQVNATATTGDNTASGSGVNTISTGNAQAMVNSTTVANMNITGDVWFFLILNNAGGWTGNILNWSSAGSIEKAGTGVTFLQSGLNPLTAVDSNNPDGTSGAPPITFDNNNLAVVDNNINVAANTGGNTATAKKGDSNIFTGDAWALANLTNLVNLNILGSRWFISNINILGHWSGDAIFAYPDVGVAIASDRDDVQPGDIINLDVKYGNTGYDTARGVRVNLDLPAGMSYVADTGKLTGGCQQTFCSWEVGTLNPKQVGDFGVSVRINDDFNFDQKLSFLDNFIPSVRAESERRSREIPIKADIQMAESDPDMTNNSFAMTAVVYEKIDNGATDSRQPDISVTANNNVNNFVYPGDIVTFEIKVNNNADVPLSNAQLIQKLYSPSGDFIGSMLFELGKIEAYKSGRVTFGLTVPASAGAGAYKTEAYVTGNAPNGNQVTSGTATTQFKVKVKAGVPAALPTNQGEVLGASTTYRGPWCTDRKQDIWIFVMLLLTSTVLFTNRIEDKLSKNYVKKTG